MIILRFGNSQYNAFVNNINMKVMIEKDVMDPITRLRSEVGSMIPQMEETWIQETRKKEGAL